MRHHLCFISFYISWFVCSMRYFMDKLGVFHAIYVLIHIWIWGGDGAVKLVLVLKWKYFYWPFQSGASFVDHFCCLCFVFAVFSCLFIVALWSSAGKGLTSWLSCVWCFIVFLTLFHVVCWVRCGAWLYLFLTLAFFLTFKFNQNVVGKSNKRTVKIKLSFSN